MDPEQIKLMLADFFQDYFYWVDFGIATLIFIVVMISYITKKMGKTTWIYYWIGCLIGLLWELPMSLANEYGTYPPAHFLTPMPTPFIVIVITHCWWDGGLFLVGVFLVKKILAPPHFTKFSGYELIIMILWGQISELSVELMSTYSEGWEFNEYWWNPVLFTFNSHNICLLPQIIWLVAPIVFYLVILKLSPNLPTHLSHESKDFIQK